VDGVSVFCRGVTYNEENGILTFFHLFYTGRTKQKLVSRDRKRRVFQQAKTVVSFHVCKPREYIAPYKIGLTKHPQPDILRSFIRS